MIRAIQSPRGLTDEEAVLLARFRMLSTSSRAFIAETMWSLNRREAQRAAERPQLRLVQQSKGLK